MADDRGERLQLAVTALELVAPLALLGAVLEEQHVPQEVAVVLDGAEAARAVELLAVAAAEGPLELDGVGAERALEVHSDLVARVLAGVELVEPGSDYLFGPVAGEGRRPIAPDLDVPLGVEAGDDDAVDAPDEPLCAVGPVGCLCDRRRLPGSHEPADGAGGSGDRRDGADHQHRIRKRDTERLRQHEVDHAADGDGGNDRPRHHSGVAGRERPDAVADGGNEPAGHEERRKRE